MVCRRPARAAGRCRGRYSPPAMNARAAHRLNRALLVAILGAMLWFVLTIPARSPPGEQSQERSPTATAVTPVQVDASGGALLVPVAGVARAQLTDTFTATRGSGRSHDAIDIM